ncbi:MAG: hypothetical protein KC475_07820 [Cyanobacteria bacterium HKST-UBA03]|nr:hypothetical protein [Cyanobacteria bacterium HKST-UBA03]
MVAPLVPVWQTPRPGFGQAPPLPLSVTIATNQVWNRLVVGLLGYEASQVATSRNPYELVERGLHVISWIGVGILMPLLLERFVSPRISNHLRKKFKLPQSNQSLLRIPFQLLDHNQHHRRIAHYVAAAQRRHPVALSQLSDYGLTSFKPLYNKQLLSDILMAKQGILLLDLLMLGSQGQLYAWGKNWLSKRLSGKMGYTGEFNYASDAYLRKQTKQYEAQKKARTQRSLWVGYGANIALPLLIVGPLLRNKGIKSGGIGFGKLKQLIPILNYTNAIFMSKWVMLWNDVFNWSFANFSAARDKHEVRERLWEHGSFYFFFYFGDVLLSGLGAQALAKQFKAQGRKMPLSLVKHHKVLGLRLPIATHLNSIYEAVGRQPNHWLYKAARRNFWAGLLGTSLGMALIKIGNNIYTYRTVQAEEQSGLANKQFQVKVPQVGVATPQLVQYFNQATVRG